MSASSSSSGISSSSSRAFAGDSGIFSSPVDPKRIALEQCINRIEHVIQQAKLGMLNRHLGESEKATLSCLSNQLKEGKFQEAIDTLESCGSDALNVSSLIAGLKLQLCPSPENISWAMIRASHQKKPEDRIFIYTQVIAHASTQLDAYGQLIFLTQDPKEKRELLFKAADLAHAVEQFDLEESLRLEAGMLSLPTVISKEEWAAAQTINLPPYPQELESFLAGDCTIWPGKKRSETHIVVPLFPQVNIDGSPIPSTLESLDQLDKSSGGPGYRFLWDKIPKNIPADQEFHYAVMTKDVIPGSRNRPYDDQIRLLPDGYEAPGVFDAARAILWENRRSGRRCLPDNPWTFTRCKEIVLSGHLVVGCFTPAGLSVGRSYFGIEGIGVAGWRKF